MSSADAELQTLADTVDEAKGRVVALAHRLEGAKREDAAASLFEVERALATAVRQIEVARTRLR